MTTLEQIVELLRGRRGAYHNTFRSIAGHKVLQDLAVFCRANETAGVPGSPDLTWNAIGRREVFLRIQQHLNLSPEDLARLYGGKSLNPGGDDD